MTTKIMLLCVAIMMMLLGAAVVKVGVPRVEKAECLKWQQQKETYPLFNAPIWQIEQCDNYNIDLR